MKKRNVGKADVAKKFQNIRELIQSAKRKIYDVSIESLEINPVLYMSDGSNCG